MIPKRADAFVQSPSKWPWKSRRSTLTSSTERRSIGIVPKLHLEMIPVSSRGKSVPSHCSPRHEVYEPHCSLENKQF